MIHGLSHGTVTLIRIIEVRYGACVVSGLCRFGSRSFWPWIISALCFR